MVTPARTRAAAGTRRTGGSSSWPDMPSTCCRYSRRRLPPRGSSARSTAGRRHPASASAGLASEVLEFAAVADGHSRSDSTGSD